MEPGHPVGFKKNHYKYVVCQYYLEMNHRLSWMSIGISPAIVQNSQYKAYDIFIITQIGKISKIIPQLFFLLYSAPKFSHFLGNWVYTPT